MASFTMSTARLAAPAKVSGLGFRKAISAVRLAAKPAPVATKAVAMTVCKTKAKPGHGKAKTNKSAAKRFKITASGKVRLRPPPRLASRARARSRRARISHRRIGFRVCSSEVWRENIRANRRRDGNADRGTVRQPARGGARATERSVARRSLPDSHGAPRSFRPDPAADRLASPPFFFPDSRAKQVLHRRPGKQHLNSHMSTRHKKRLSGERQIGREQIPLIKGLLPHSRKAIR